MINLAVLLTCHNRKINTINCLRSLQNITLPNEINKIDIFLVDDGSTDGTYEEVKREFPNVYVTKSNGTLFWAGGMKLAWEVALSTSNFDVFLLLNDDVELHPDVFKIFLKTNEFSIEKYKKAGIYSAPTLNKKTKKTTYGGNKIINKGFRYKTKRMSSSDKPIDIDLVNANILWVDSSVVKQIGTLDKRFTHGIADYDFSLRSKKAGFPVLLTTAFGGYCENDHERNWLSNNHTLSERIKFLKSPKGLAYNEYLYFVKTHFPLSLPYSFFMIWLKTLVPQLWNYFKK
jgi:GT2 family glycosyltransferase